MGRRAPSPGPPRSAVLLAAAVLGSCLQPVPGQATAFAILRDPDPATVGGNVTFTLQPTPSNVVMCVWYRASDTVHSSEILSYAPSYNPPQSNGTAFTGRETGGPGCSMHIRDLWMNDTSAYTVQIWNPGSTTASTNLTVYELLLQPSVMPQNVTVTENGTFSLTCDPPASTETLLWLRDGALLAAGGRLALSDDNRTLTVTPAARTDAGAYVCEARNPVSSNRSEATNVTVAYGPDAAAISPPSPVRVPLGSRVELACVADAVPSPRYAWTFGNTTLGRESLLVFVFRNATQAGEYRCVATNPALGRAAAAALLLQTPQPGLSAGAVAGIVVGTLLGLVLLGAAGYLLWRRKRGSPQRGGGGPGAAAPHPPPTTAHPPHELPSANGSPSTEEDIKYSTLAFRDGAAPRDTAPGPPCDSSTIYSEVKQT